MDINTMANLISQVGVPIALLFATFWLLDKERTDHKEEVNTLTTAIENNTIALTKFLERMENNE